jgi:hypothetical protein
MIFVRLNPIICRWRLDLDWSGKHPCLPHCGFRSVTMAKIVQVELTPRA